MAVVEITKDRLWWDDADGNNDSETAVVDDIEEDADAAGEAVVLGAAVLLAVAAADGAVVEHETTRMRACPGVAPGGVTSVRNMTPSERKATKFGYKSAAAEEGPSANELEPLPLIVLTPPSGVMARTKQPLASATTSAPPVADHERPRRVLKSALAPKPSWYPAAPTGDPARVLTPAVAITTLRTTIESVTYSSPALCTSARATGDLNDAAAPMPSIEASEPSPASVVTTPRGVTTRTRLFMLSAR